MKEIEKQCPCCPNHCDVDHLRCGRGRAYFKVEQNSTKDDSNHLSEKDESSMTLEEKVIAHIRKCGHFLHHSDGDIHLDFLSDAEKENLMTMLSKCLDNWSK